MGKSRKVRSELSDHAPKSSLRANPLRYRIMRVAFRWVFRFLVRWEVTGSEHIPSSGPFILSINHLHLFDPPFLMAALPFHVTVLVAEKYREKFLFGGIVKHAGGIFVRRGEIDRAALRRCIEVLRSGGVLGFSPEGTRSLTGALQRGKLGIAYVAHKTGAPILPLAVWGLETLGVSLRHLRRARVHVAIGELFNLPPVEGKPRASNLQLLADQVMYRIAELMPAKYRGVYAGEIPGASTQMII